MFQPGDVIEFHSVIAQKKKYHLCISLNGCFLFINSPKAKAYPGDFDFPCSELPFLTPTASGDSIVSCSQILRYTDGELLALHAKKIGVMKPPLVILLLSFIENSTVLSDAEKKIALDGLGDWV